MEALDLRKAPPRSPHVELGGLLMLARTIDKLRATLPGGNPGVYYIKGFSRGLLDGLGISEDSLREVVARANGDEEVVAWVREHSDPSKYPQINAAMQSATVGQSLERTGFLERYPSAKNLPVETTLFEMLDVDDAAMFR
jgi:hypothetical protein